MCMCGGMAHADCTVWWLSGQEGLGVHVGYEYICASMCVHCDNACVLTCRCACVCMASVCEHVTMSV